MKLEDLLKEQTISMTIEQFSDILDKKFSEGGIDGLTEACSYMSCFKPNSVGDII